jgi:hypothetical protein
MCVPAMRMTSTSAAVPPVSGLRRNVIIVPSGE